MLKKNEYTRDLLCSMYSGSDKYSHFTVFPRVGPVKILTLTWCSPVLAITVILFHTP